MDGGEDDAAGGTVEEEVLQVLTGFGLLGRLAEDLGAAVEGAKELTIQVDAVGNDDDGGIFHLRLDGQAPGIEDHGVGLTGALGMPDNADAPVARDTGRGSTGGIVTATFTGGADLLRGADGLIDGDVGGVELVVTGDDLGGGGAMILLEHDEVADEGKQALLIKNAAQEHFQLGDMGGSGGFTLDGLPGEEPFLVGGERTHAGIQSIGNDEQFVVVKEGGDLLLVGLQLVEGGPEGGVLVGGVLELDDGDGQPVDENDDIRAAVVVFGTDDGELVEDEPIVIFRIFKIDGMDGGGGILPEGEAVFDRDAVDEQGSGKAWLLRSKDGWLRRESWR